LWLIRKSMILEPTTAISQRVASSPLYSFVMSFLQMIQLFANGETGDLERASDQPNTRRFFVRRLNEDISLKQTSPPA
jgi:hypothetical protein